MTTVPLRLIFKRSQSARKEGTPIFHVTAQAEITTEFQQAVDKYGLWQEEIWRDPMLEEEEKEERLTALEREDRRNIRKRGFGAWIEGLDPIILLMIFPLWISYKIAKLTVLIPVWIYRMRTRTEEANKTQDERIMRFSELKIGKTLTAPSFHDVIDIEEEIEESAKRIAQYVESALDYSGELIVTDHSG